VALKLRPALEEDILSGKFSVEKVAALGRVFQNPNLAKDEADWLKCAEQWSTHKLQQEIQKKEREAETGGPVSKLFAILTAGGRALFERARVVASRKKKRILDEGETIEVLSEHYLDSFDDDRKKPRKRRAPDTTGRPGRSVPEDVKRAVRSRPHGDCCAVPGCDNKVFLEYAHKQPHWDGGSREKWNLHWLCRMHGRLYDEGKLQITGSPDWPTFHFPDGRVIEGFEPPAPGDGTEEPGGGKGAPEGDPGEPDGDPEEPGAGTGETGDGTSEARSDAREPGSGAKETERPAPP
jgi:hypothetical protein